MRGALALPILVATGLALAGLDGSPNSASAHDGAGLSGARLDAAAAERALRGAEWLATRANSDGEVRPADASPAELTGWLLDRGAPATEQGGGDFGAELTTLGYGDPAWAESLWIEEFVALLEVYRATLGGPALRSLAEVDADIASLPTVPLDEAGAAERDRLMGEWARGAMPADFLSAVAGLATRIEAVLDATAGTAKP